MKGCELSSHGFYKRFIRAFPEFKEWTDNEIEFIKQILSGKERIIDVGCGWGRGLKELAPYCKEIIGIDIDPLEIKYAKNYAGKSRKS